MKPRYNYVYEKIVETLEDLGEDLIFPLNFEKIIEKKGWELIKYNMCDFEHMEKSPHGYSIYDGNNFKIYVNFDDPIGVRQFTLGHEYAHVVLNHHIEYGHRLIGYNEKINDSLEKEANCFARNIICPAVLINDLKPRTLFILESLFGISQKEADIRLDWQKYDFSRTKHINQNIVKNAKIDLKEKLHIFIDELYKY